jgi:hypothetical protein
MRYEVKPLGVGATLDQAILILKDRVVLFLSIVLVLRVPALLVFQYLVIKNVGTFPLVPNEAEMNALMSRMMRLYLYVLGPGFFIYILLISPLTDTALIYAASRTYLGERVTLGQSLKVALRRFFPMVWTSILFYIIFGAGWVCCFCCFLPGILVYVFFVLSMTIAVLEPISGFGAMGRSRALIGSLTAPNFINLFLLLAVLFVFQWEIGAASSVIPQMHLQVVAAAVVGSVAYTLSIVSLVVFYYSSRCRSEGFDLLRLARIVAETPIEQPALEGQG